MSKKETGPPPPDKKHQPPPPPGPPPLSAQCRECGCDAELTKLRAQVIESSEYVAKAAQLTVINNRLKAENTELKEANRKLHMMVSGYPSAMDKQ